MVAVSLVTSLCRVEVRSLVYPCVSVSVYVQRSSEWLAFLVGISLLWMSCFSAAALHLESTKDHEALQTRGLAADTGVT